MTIDLAAQYAAVEDTAANATAPYMDEMRGSSILAIAGQVRQLRAEGKQIYNLTIGDFNPSIFPIPDALRDRIKAKLDAGHTNYPPAVGAMPLREAITSLYRRELGLDVPVDAVLVGSGARPPIYATFGVIVAPGDTVVYPVPSWNVNHYCYLNRARGVPIVTKPEHGFMPTAEDLAPYISEARLIAINSPQNPSGTVITEELLGGICDAILAENTRRRGTGERPLFLLYDAVYWRLTYGDNKHLTPIGLRPEMAPYTILIDAVSKWWAGTGLRVGWCVAPPWVRAKMQALTGHMGAWAAHAEQLAVADLLENPEPLQDFMPHFKRQLKQRLELLQRGIEDMASDGLPISCLPAAGAIYLAVRLDLIGRKAPDGAVLDSDEAVRSYVLENAGVAFVPFTAFGYPQNTGWIRFSVGSVGLDDVQGTLANLRKLLTPFAQA